MKTKKLLSKKSFIVLLVAVFMIGISITGNSQTSASGDVNNNGKIDIIDAMLIAQYGAGLFPSPFNLLVADVNCDGVVNVIDALIVARYTAGIIPWPTCKPPLTPTPTITPTPTFVIPIYSNIINAKSAKLITTLGMTASTILMQQAYMTPNWSDEVQSWVFTPQTDGYCTIVSKQTKMALTVDNASTQAGAYVSCAALLASSNAHQQWKFLTTPSGYMKIVNRQSNLYLGVEGASLNDSARLVQVADTTGSEILWGTTEAVPPPSPTGCDMIGWSFCFSVHGGTVIKENSGTPVNLTVRAFKSTVTPAPIAGSNIVVNYTLSGKATNGQDVEYLSGKVTVFAENYVDGDTTTPPADGIIAVKPLDDAIPEGLEGLYVKLSYPGATDIVNGAVFIVDDDLK